MTNMGATARALIVLGLASAISGGRAWAQEPAERPVKTAAITLNIPALPLGKALTEFARQSGFQVMLYTRVGEGITSPSVVGSYTADAALALMLENTDLRTQWMDGHTVAIHHKGSSVGETSLSIDGAKSKGDELRLAQIAAPSPGDARGASEQTNARAGQDGTSSEAGDVESTKGIPEVFVTGSRMLNMDVTRTADDPQPYQILDSETIGRSGSTSVEDFLKQMLPANTSALSNGQLNVNAAGNSSKINLRNLGTASTLVLVNGRRAIGASYFGDNLQADVNTIPLAAIERIEVLPSAASAIYGGAAMGGVVNVVLKQNYEGGEVKVRYENTFDSDAPNREVDMTYGMPFEEGRTHVLLAAHFSDRKALVNADRPELLQAGIDRVLQNSPGLLFSPTNPFHIGTTPNITSSDGSNLTLKDGTPLGSPFTHIPSGYNVGSDPALLVANAGTFNTTLPRTGDYYTGLARPLGSAPEVRSLMAVARRQMTDKLELFSEFTLGVNQAEAVFNPLNANYVVPASAPTNPFAQSVRVSIPDNTQNNYYETKLTSRRAVLGFIYDLPAGWKVEGDYTWNGVDNRVLAQYARLTEPLASGEINPFVDTLAFPSEMSAYISGQDGTPYYSGKSYLRDVGLRFVGNVGRLPAGKPVVTIGLGYREEGLKAATNTAISVGSPAFRNYVRTYFPQSQNVYSLYSEGLIPLVSADNRVAGIHNLDLQLSVRSERYTTNSGTASAVEGSGIEPVYSHVGYTSTNTTIGLRYEIVEGLALRASFSSAFLPPTYSQLLPDGLTSIATVAVIDPRRGNSTALARVINGGNADLKPTDTDNYNLGIVFQPSFAPGLRLNADWFRFDQDNVIVSPSVLQVVNNESSFPSRVTRDPVAPGDPYGVGPITLVDQRLINGNRAKIRGVDFGLSYVRNTLAHGSFQFSSAATLFQKYETQTVLGAPLIDKVNQVADGGPLKFKANASLAWDFQPWSAGWSSYYYGSYDQYAVGNDLYVLAQGSGTVPSQIYHDLFVGYRFPGVDQAQGRSANVLSDVSIRLGVKNVFDEKPPFDAFYSMTAYYSPFGDPRMRSYSLSISKAF